MTTKKIPARTEVYCDSCERLCGDGGQRRIKDGELQLKRHALDLYGNPAASGDLKLDLCDSCEHTIGEAINAAVARIRLQVTDAAR